MARIVILSEGMTGKTHELVGDKTTIGRVEDNIFPVPAPSVSSHHCEIFARGSDIMVRDLNSTNGTFINGNQVTGEAVLKPGQILRLGEIEMRLEDPAAKPPAPQKQIDKTMVLPQGVKVGGEPSTAVTFDKNTFAKKKNTATQVFIAVIVVIAIVVIALLVKLFA